MSKQRRNDQGVIKQLNSDHYNRHFLPTLSPYKSLSSLNFNSYNKSDDVDDQFEPLYSHSSRSKAVDQSCKHRHSSGPESEDFIDKFSSSINGISHSKEKNKINGRRIHEHNIPSIKESTDEDKSSTPTLIAPEAPLVPPHTAIMVNSDISDKKKDRKSQARRHLVEGLNSTHNRNNGCPTRRNNGLYRSHTFNFNANSNIHDATSNHLVHKPHVPKAARRSKTDTLANQGHVIHNGRGALHNNNAIHSSDFNLNSDRTKAVIENWNELMLEMNSHQKNVNHNSKNNHLAVLSDSSSSDDFVPSPTSKYNHSSTHFVYGPHPKFSLSSSMPQGVSIISNSKLAGLGFTRYRPITPNLLDRLDKLKLSSRKKTQRWVNQLQVQRRFNSETRTKSTLDEQPGVLLPETNHMIRVEGEETHHYHSSKDASCPTPTSEKRTLKPLKKTESYDSSRTRQSSFGYHAKQAQADFI